MKTETIDRITAHYEHAKRKHPKFVDMLYSGSYHGAKCILDIRRDYLKKLNRTRGFLDSDDILGCEIAEIYEAYKGGRLADAKEECYDAIAVLLRMIDMIDAEQIKPEADDSDIEETIADLREVER